LIIDRADMFGLSDLYQLKGRVGRFTNKAYAYLLIPRNMVVSEESEKRLRAIEKFTDLGSGFKVAMEDLEIRGAGNILGHEQHGYIYAVGFDLYCKLLNQVIKTGAINVAPTINL
jgi:transcription-repair coupling factor (superfamily II helicase)